MKLHKSPAETPDPSEFYSTEPCASWPDSYIPNPTNSFGRRCNAMTLPFDSSDGMQGDERFGNDPLRIDDALVESMLSGNVTETDVPETYVEVAQLLTNAGMASVAT